MPQGKQKPKKKKKKLKEICSLGSEIIETRTGGWLVRQIKIGLMSVFHPADGQTEDRHQTNFDFMSSANLVKTELRKGNVRT